jgi:Sulfotransferase family
MLPTFLLIGAMKSGTTTLQQYLTRHPQVYMCTPKEPNFFNDHWHRGVGWYERRQVRLVHGEVGAAVLAQPHVDGAGPAADVEAVRTTRDDRLDQVPQRRRELELLRKDQRVADGLLSHSSPPGAAPNARRFRASRKPQSVLGS